MRLRELVSPEDECPVRFKTEGNSISTGDFHSHPYGSNCA